MNLYDVYMHYGGVPKFTKKNNNKLWSKSIAICEPHPIFWRDLATLGLFSARSRQHADDFNGKFHRPAAKAAAAAADTEPPELNWNRRNRCGQKTGILGFSQAFPLDSL